MINHSLAGRTIGHLDEFVRLSVASRLLAMRVLPDAKEITESMACFSAIRQYMPGNWSFADEDILCVSVADGHTPRTAALIHEMTRWKVWSCDPAMRDDKIAELKAPLPRLTAIKCVASELPKIIVNKLVIAAVHAHNYQRRPSKGTPKPSILDDTLSRIQAKEIMIVALPCCHNLHVNDQEPSVEFHDPGIWSEKNSVRVWYWRN